MRRLCLPLLICAICSSAHARMPSKTAILSCLAAQAMSPYVKWRPFSTEKIFSEDNYNAGFNVTYYIITDEKRVGYAERGEKKAILYGDELFLAAQARLLPGFATHPTELNPFSADWGTVMDGSGSYLCVSFPFGDLGQSGSFKENRSAYLIAVGHGARRILYAASGRIDSLPK